MSKEKLKENPTSAELIQALEKNKHSHENVLKLLGQLSILIIAREESFENLSYTAFCFAEVLNSTNSWDAHISEIFNLLSEKSESYKDSLQLVRFSTVGSNYDESFAEKMLKNALDQAGVEFDDWMLAEFIYTFETNCWRRPDLFEKVCEKVEILDLSYSTIVREPSSSTHLIVGFVSENEYFSEKIELQQHEQGERLCPPLNKFTNLKKLTLCWDYPSISDEWASVFKNLNSLELQFSGLKELSDSAAACLTQASGEISLFYLEYLSDFAAHCIASSNSDMIELNLTELSDAAAESLAKYKGDLQIPSELQAKVDSYKKN